MVSGRQSEPPTLVLQTLSKPCRGSQRSETYTEAVHAIKSCTKPHQVVLYQVSANMHAGARMQAMGMDCRGERRSAKNIGKISSLKCARVTAELIASRRRGSAWRSASVLGEAQGAKVRKAVNASVAKLDRTTALCHKSSWRQKYSA